jgi:hypothetical protein
LALGCCRHARRHVRNLAFPQRSSVLPFLPGHPVIGSLRVMDDRPSILHAICAPSGTSVLSQEPNAVAPPDGIGLDEKGKEGGGMGWDGLGWDVQFGAGQKQKLEGRYTAEGQSTVGKKQSLRPPRTLQKLIALPDVSRRRFHNSSIIYPAIHLCI